MLCEHHGPQNNSGQTLCDITHRLSEEQAQSSNVEAVVVTILAMLDSAYLPENTRMGKEVELQKSWMLMIVNVCVVCVLRELTNELDDS